MICFKLNTWGKLIGSSLLLLLLIFIPITVGASDKEETRRELEGQINQLQQQINEYQQKIKTTQGKAQNVQNEISILENEISKVRLQINQIDLVIQESNLNIEQIENSIVEIEKRINLEKLNLAEYIRLVDRNDQESLLEIVLKKDSFSEFFDEINVLERFQSQIHVSLEEIRQSRIKLESHKNNLEEERDQQYQLKSLQVSQRRSIENNQNTKEALLHKIKGEEKEYLQIVQKSQSDIDHIKKQMFLLENVGLEMTLQRALDHALFASVRTGVRPAFLLAILKKESSWGNNVGTGTYLKDMHPARHPAFIRICEELGLNPATTPVSAKPSYGWGGAMGPAQFMPETWLGYKDEIARVTGHNPPNPWNVDDAFTASAIKLARDGANQRTPAAEHKAAMIYFAGSRWNNPIYQWYGDQVMELAGVIQQELDKLQK